MDDTVEPRASLLHWRVPLLTAGVPPPTPAVAFQAPLSAASIATTRPIGRPGRCLPPHTASGSPAIDADRSDGMTVKRSEEHTSELQSLMRSSYAVFCLKKKTQLQTPLTKAKFIYSF